MKKLNNILIAVFVCFFVFSLSLKADDLVYKVNLFDFNVNQANPLAEGIDVFNYFEEKKNNTTFYQFLEEKGSSLVSYLNIDKNNDNDWPDYALAIFTKDEFDYIFSNTNIYADSNKFTDYSSIDYDHVIVYSYAKFKFKVTNDYISSFLTNYYSSYSGRTSYYYFFKGSDIVYNTNDTDTYGVKLSYILQQYKFSFSWISSGFWFWKNETYQGTNFAYLLSKFYFSSSSVDTSALNLTLDLNYACFSEFCYNFNTDDSSIMADNNLQYLVDYPLFSSNYNFLPLLNMFNYDNQSRFDSIPDTFNSVRFDLSNNLSLFPISSCNVKDFQLYLYTNESKKVKLYLHTIDELDNLGYLASYYSVYETEKNVLYNINPLYYLTDVYSDSSTINFTDNHFVNYYYRFQGEDNKANYYIYYNPSCYVISENYQETTFVNVKTGNNITFTSDSSQVSWKDPENVNQGNSVSSFNFSADVSKVVGDLKNVSSSFVSAAAEIVSLSTALFNELPDEVSTLLLGCFLIVIFIGIIKILKNII